VQGYERSENGKIAEDFALEDKRSNSARSIEFINTVGSDSL
jgi:hypothetical protein